MAFNNIVNNWLLRITQVYNKQKSCMYLECFKKWFSTIKDEKLFTIEEITRFFNEENYKCQYYIEDFNIKNKYITNGIVDTTFVLKKIDEIEMLNCFKDYIDGMVKLNNLELNKETIMFLLTAEAELKLKDGRIFKSDYNFEEFADLINLKSHIRSAYAYHDLINTDFAIVKSIKYFE